MLEDTIKDWENPELLPYMDYLRQKRKSGKGKFN
jgi:hypothetical protein